MGAPRRRILQAALILAATGLAGCAGSNASPENAGDARVVTVALPYQEAYRGVRQYAKSCFEAGLITAEMKVDADLFTDIKRGEIRIYVLGALGRQD